MDYRKRNASTNTFLGESRKSIYLRGLDVKTANNWLRNVMFEWMDPDKSEINSCRSYTESY